MSIQIDNRWKYDYLNTIGKVHNVLINWLEKFSVDSDSTTWDTEGHMVDIKGLAGHIQREGLIHPGTIEVSRETKHARLVAGNHRIKAMHDELQKAYFPVYVVIRDKFDDDLGAGITQEDNLLNIVDETKGDVIVAPQEVFADIAELVKNGNL
jgi:hypothetical protein